MTPQKIIGADQVQKLRTTGAAQAGTRSGQESWGIPCAARPIGKPMTPTKVLRFPTTEASTTRLSYTFFLERIGCNKQKSEVNKEPNSKNKISGSLKLRAPRIILQPCKNKDPTLEALIISTEYTKDR